jgi:hypothetical protein
MPQGEPYSLATAYISKLKFAREQKAVTVRES